MPPMVLVKRLGLTLVTCSMLLTGGCAKLQAIKEAEYAQASPEWKTFYDEMVAFQRSLASAEPEIDDYLDLLKKHEHFVETAQSEGSLFRTGGKFEAPRVPADVIMRTRYRYFALRHALTEYQNELCRQEKENLELFHSAPIRTLTQWQSFQRALETHAAEVTLQLAEIGELPDARLCPQNPFINTIKLMIVERARAVDEHMEASIKTLPVDPSHRHTLEDASLLAATLASVNKNATNTLTLSAEKLRALHKQVEIANNNQQYEQAMTTCRKARPKTPGREQFWKERFIHSYLGTVAIAEPMDKFYCRHLQAGRTIDRLDFSSRGKTVTVALFVPDKGEQMTFKLHWDAARNAWSLHSWLKPADAKDMSLVQEIVVLRELFQPPAF